MLAFPNIDPVIFTAGPFQVRWYGLIYIIGFALGYVFIKKNLDYKKIKITREQYESMMFSIILGVIIGARVGYVLFYNLLEYLHEPLKVFAVWEGGMSFHGGVLGVIVFGWIFVKKNKLSFYQLGDAVVPFAALGLGIGRIGNFINAELYGRVTNVPWAMVFPGSDGLPRHPSQLYQALLEGFLLFAVLLIMYRKVKGHGYVFWTFIGGYGALRFVVEFFREPDQHLGYFFGIFTLGQILCFAMMVLATIGIITIRMNEKKRVNQ